MATWTRSHGQDYMGRMKAAKAVGTIQRCVYGYIAGVNRYVSYMTLLSNR